jgi:hypothetical protein
MNTDRGRRCCDAREGKARNEESCWKHDERASAEQSVHQNFATITSLCPPIDQCTRISTVGILSLHTVSDGHVSDKDGSHGCW